MKIAHITAFHLKEAEISPEKWAHFTRWEQTNGWLNDETLREKWISFDCLLYLPQNKLVYVGLTALNGDIFYTFDPHTGEFISLDYPAGGDRYAHKIHKSLQLAPDGFIYGAVATLGDVDIWPFARGGEIFRFNPQVRQFEPVCIPIAHDYIQGIILDKARHILYGDTFPGRKLFRYDLVTGEIRELAMFGNVSTEQLFLDAQGGLWHHYELAQWAGRFPLLRYDPDRDLIEYLNLDLPDIASTGPKASFVDSALMTRDERLYLGTASGALILLNTQKRKLEYLGKPLPGPRLKGLLEMPNGLILGAGGSKYETFLFSYDPATRAFQNLGLIQDTRDGTRCWLAHDACLIDPQTLVIAETDNPQRASCLYRITLVP